MDTNNISIEEYRANRFAPGPGREAILANWINENNFSKIVELGVLDGFTAQEILKSCPHIVEYVGVDIFEKPDIFQSIAPKNDRSREVYNSFDFNFYYKLTLENLKDFTNKVTILKTTTLEASYLYPNMNFDLVFIDADHSYEGVAQDIQMWLPKIRSGGILAGHDFNWHTVRQAVKNCLGLEKITLHEDNVWRYDKR